jgi:bifunctional DNA-binding transcriptional regulator/antitoxin component of YhaV-PrlF toxin-antitoxin module
MSNTVTTITSKWQVTIPEAVRDEFLLKIGQRIVWEVEGDKLVGRRVRSLGELAGCLQVDKTKVRGGDPGSFAEAAIARHERIAKQKS